MVDAHSDDTDIQCITSKSDMDSAALCAADLESLSRLVDRIRDVRAAFQAACDTFDMSTLDLWISGASNDDACLFQLMLDFNTKYLLQKKVTGQSGEKEAKQE